MKLRFYFKIAIDGIKRNKQLYIPYIVLSAFMVWMFYMMIFLGNLPILDTLDSVNTMKAFFIYGIVFIVILSIFSIYESSMFLNKQREHEYGLYNVFGMNKKNIVYVLICENVIVSNFSIIIGFILGVTMSKFAEVCLLNLISIEVNYKFYINKKALLYTYIFFTFVFIILQSISMIRISRLNTISLIKSNQIGEKPPKVNWFKALLGVILIISIYYRALKIEYSILVLYDFLFMACLVMIATRLLFVSGSVALCRILKLNKKYYYNPKHYISVSVMSYRMKKNGAKLADICIMSTATLVLVFLTSSLYINFENDLRNRFNYDLEICTIYNPSYDSYNEENFDVIRKFADNINNKKNIYEYKNASITGKIDNGNVIPTLDNNILLNPEAVYVGFISLDDYNKITGKNEKLESGECIIGFSKEKYNIKNFSINGELPLNVKKTVDSMLYTGNEEFFQKDIKISVIIKDYDKYIENLMNMKDETGRTFLTLYWNYAFDFDLPDDEKYDVSNKVYEQVKEISENASFDNYNVKEKVYVSTNSYHFYGGMIFLGITLSIVFFIVSVVIMYYKQISEGYEDRARFDIMKKVGMTDKDIRKTIKSQVLIMLFIPLVVAGMHYIFAFPFVWVILKIFNFVNLKLAIKIAIGCYVIFAVFYFIVYKITSDVYYSIVTSGKK